MSRREREKQKKKMARQERLRREKHLGKAEPRSQDRHRAEAKHVNETKALPETLSSGSTELPDLADSSPQTLDNFFVGEPAREWLDKLLAGTDTMPIVNALDPVSYVPDELLLKASVCCEMLVAAELVAAGRGRPSRHLPLLVAAWLVERDVLFSPGLVTLAASAVRRVGAFSELRHLFDAVHLGQEWQRGVEHLHERLQG